MFPILSFPLRSRPLPLADDAQTRRIDDEMDGFTGRRSTQLHIQSLRTA